MYFMVMSYWDAGVQLTHPLGTEEPGLTLQNANFVLDPGPNMLCRRAHTSSIYPSVRRHLDSGSTVRNGALAHHADSATQCYFAKRRDINSSHEV